MLGAISRSDRAAVKLEPQVPFVKKQNEPFACRIVEAIGNEGAT